MKIYNLIGYVSLHFKWGYILIPKFWKFIFRFKIKFNNRRVTKDELFGIFPLSKELTNNITNRKGQK